MKAAALLYFWACLAAAARQPAEPAARIAVRVIGSHRVPAAILAAAERLAANIFREAGVGIEWVDCDAAGKPCNAAVQATDFWLQLLARRPNNVPGLLDGDALGYSLLVPGCSAGCGYAAVSYPTVLSLSRAMERDTALLFGSAMAHEIGHLLLGHDSHTRAGIMSPRLGVEQMEQAGRGLLRFPPDQARRLREQVLARSAR